MQYYDIAHIIKVSILIFSCKRFIPIIALEANVCNVNLE